ncbi:MAG: chemotaxis protein CheW [Betaproteobacteria bacterium]|nr:chemotaxis protein CheW [Betaproteobacteria bacterium]
MLQDALHEDSYAGSPAKAGIAAQVQEYLTYRVGAEEYGIDILKVQEIRGYEAVTPIANSPAWLKGIINLRGTIVPVVDMRIKFNLEKVDYDQFTVVIILSVAGRVIGMVVDGVSDVIGLAAEQIRPAPEMGGAVDARYIVGLGTVETGMIILVDIEQLMSSADMALFEKPVH